MRLKCHYYRHSFPEVEMELQEGFWKSIFSSLYRFFFQNGEHAHKNTYIQFKVDTQPVFLENQRTRRKHTQTCEEHVTYHRGKIRTQVQTWSCKTYSIFNKMHIGFASFLNILEQWKALKWMSFCFVFVLYLLLMVFKQKMLSFNSVHNWNKY